MENSLTKMLQGYMAFREKYVHGDFAIMQYLASEGQRPNTMVVACCDSRVDPALILQCDPGDLFVVRNVANIIPPYERDGHYHGTSAALEFGISFLRVEHLIILGHSQCGGIHARFRGDELGDNDFIATWVSQIHSGNEEENIDDCAKNAILQSHAHCQTFPWIKEKVDRQQLKIHPWFFDIKEGRIFAYDGSAWSPLNEKG